MVAGGDLLCHQGCARERSARHLARGLLTDGRSFNSGCLRCLGCLRRRRGLIVGRGSCTVMSGQGRLVQGRQGWHLGCPVWAGRLARGPHRARRAWALLRAMWHMRGVVALWGGTRDIVASAAAGTVGTSDRDRERCAR